MAHQTSSLNQGTITYSSALNLLPDLPESARSFAPLGSYTHLDANTLNSRPVIRFKMQQQESRAGYWNGAAIVLPMTDSIEMAEQASYDDTNLGIFGNALKTATEQLGSGATFGQALDATAEASGLGRGDWKDKLSALVTNLSDKVPLDAGKGFNIANQQTINKYVTTEFTGVNTRAYGFAFKLHGKSEAEAAALKEICNIFQVSAYPTLGAANLLKYPPKWDISFLVGGKEISTVPNIYECYLSACNVTYNGQGANWYSYKENDAAPFSIDLSLTYKESKALTAEDIKYLQH